MPIAKALATFESTRTLVFCDEDAPVTSPIDALAKVARGPVAVLIGPEGGFAPDERERLIAMPNVVRLALGPRIMRADTAAVAAMALVNAVLGDWR
jgi:16S rRNA (uracil1498-N3)-methyltransferase